MIKFNLLFILQFEPKSRPSFSEIVIRLEQIISEYRKSKHLDSVVGDKRLLTCVSLVADDKNSKVTSSLGARSEEVIPTSAAEAEALIENKETALLKKCELCFNILYIYQHAY